MINYFRTIREYIKYLPAKLFNSHNECEENDIFIFSSPRSGSTWLMEIINSQTDFKYVNEPLHTNRHKGYLTNIKPTWAEIYSGFDREYDFLNFFRKINNDKLFVGQQKLKHMYKGEFDYNTNRKVFKILRAKDLINKFEDEFEITVVYLLRHPISVALSLVKEDMENRSVYYLNNKKYMHDFFSQDQIDYSFDILKNGSKFEERILQWCLENVPPLKYLNSTKWVIVSYEELVVNEKETLKKLYNQLNLNDLDSMLKQIKKPSRTTEDKKSKELINKRNKESLIKKWENEITNLERKKAFQILNEFGIDVYLENNYFINKESEFFKN